VAVLAVRDPEPELGQEPEEKSPGSSSAEFSRLLGASNKLTGGGEGGPGGSERGADAGLEETVTNLLNGTFSGRKNANALVWIGTPPGGLPDSKCLALTICARLLSRRSNRALAKETSSSDPCSN